MINDYHGDESVVQRQAEEYGENQDMMNLVVLNRESEIHYPSEVDLKIDDLSAQTQSESVTAGSGKLHALGDALRNYAPFLSAQARPFVDLGSKDGAKLYVAPHRHLYYAYDRPDSIRFGVEIPASLKLKLSELHRYTTSIYDRESGFHPFIAHSVLRFRLAGMQLKESRLIENEKELNETLITLKKDESLPQKEIAQIVQSLTVLADQKRALSTQIAALKDNLTRKSTVVIAADDITTLDIQDVRGRVLANKVMKTGEIYQLEGSGIYDVYLGNPAVVDKIMVNGKVIPEYYYKPLTEEAVSIRFSLNAEQYH